MRNNLREAGHLVRLAVLILLAIGVFLVVRGAVVPKDFGLYGHYRPAALEEVRLRKPAFAGQAECLACHEDQAKTRASGRHAGVTCEACHGPSAVHAADPGTTKPTIADAPSLCKSCHQKDVAKPAAFPQVIVSEHNSGVPCEACHQPHAPKLQ